VKARLRDLSSVEQNHSVGELHSGEEISGEFIVTRGNCTIVLELIEETPNEIALAVERKILTARHFTVDLRRNHGRDVALGKDRNKGVGVPILAKRTQVDAFAAVFVYFSFLR
jgi:hypothetical protein